MFRVLDPTRSPRRQNALNHAVGQSIWVTLGAAMQDTPLTAMLASFGLEGANAESAMEVLYQRGLTRPGVDRACRLVRQRHDDDIGRTPFRQPDGGCGGGTCGRDERSCPRRSLACAAAGNFEEALALETCRTSMACAAILVFRICCAA